MWGKIYIDDLNQIFIDQQEWTEVLKRSIHKLLENNPKYANMVFCPNSECNGIIQRNGGYQTCITCGKMVCSICHTIDDELHEGVSCVEREKLVREMGEYLPQLFKAASTFVNQNWSASLPPIVSIEHNNLLFQNQNCPALTRFYAGYTTFGKRPPPDLRSGFFTFHGTDQSALQSICDNGFNPHYRRGQVHGPGEYFGVTADISDGYSRKSSTACDAVKHMLIAFVWRGSHVYTVSGFCHVVKNPVDWSYAYNLPVLIVSYGRGGTVSKILNTTCHPTNPTTNQSHWRAHFRWHWQTDQGNFEPYTDEVNLLLESYYVKFRFNRGPSTVVTPPIIRYIDDSPRQYSIDFHNNQQTNITSGFQRALQRRSVPSIKFNAWFFENEHGEWSRYETLIQDKIENAYQAYLKLMGPSNITIAFPGRPETYVLNFQNGTQTNQLCSTIRKIIRR